MRPKTFLALLPLLAAIAVTGCAHKNTALYNYGTYSQSYYAYAQDLSPEKALELQKAMEEAIANTGDSTSGRVPPGMYANLGYLYLKGGDSANAIESFRKEESIYPESAHFMQSMIKKVQTAEGEKKQ